MCVSVCVCGCHYQFRSILANLKSFLSFCFESLRIFPIHISFISCIWCVHFIQFLIPYTFSLWNLIVCFWFWFCLFCLFSLCFFGFFRFGWIINLSYRKHETLKIKERAREREKLFSFVPFFFLFHHILSFGYFVFRRPVLCLFK